MGLTPQMDLLKTYGESLIGIHLHDAKGLDDHLPPGSGEVNFEEILSCLKPFHIKVLEIHSKVDREELIQGLEFIKTLLNIKAKKQTEEEHSI